MRSALRPIISCLAVIALLFLFTDTALAKKKNRKKKGIAITDESFVFQAEGFTCISLPSGRVVSGTQKNNRFSPYKPGAKAKRTRRKLSKKIKRLAGQIRKAKGQEKKLRLTASRQAAVERRERLSSKFRNSRCANALNRGDGGGEELNQTNFDLTTYEGSFGPREARILFERFCFGGTPEEIDRAVAEGLDATVARMQTWRPDTRHPSFPGNPLIRDMVADAACDGYVKNENYDDDLEQSVDDDAERDCNSRNPNDVNILGVRSRLYLEAMGENCYHANLAFFLHDEFAAPTLGFAGSNECYRHLAPEYINEDLWGSAISGDYKDYVRRAYSPQHGAGYASAVLNVFGNRDPQIPNEDGAREIGELTTIGDEKLSGALNYGPFHIIQTALAFTGYVWADITLNVGTNDEGEAETTTLCSPSFSNDAHAQGLKRIFPNDPVHAADVDTLEDVIEVLLDHEYLPVEVARKMCQTFLANHNITCGTATINRIASWIVADEFNFHKTLARLMKVSAQYNGETSEALIKQPIHKFLGMYRSALFPVGKEPMSIRDFESRLVNQVNQRAFLPATIFGFFEETTVNDSRVIPYRIGLYNAWGPDGNDGNFSVQNLAEESGYSLRDRFIAGSSTSLEVVDRVAATFNIDLTPQQREVANFWLNHYVDSECSSSEVSAGICRPDQLGEEFARRDIFDPFSSEWKYVERVQGLLIMFNQLDQSFTM